MITIYMILILAGFVIAILICELIARVKRISIDVRELFTMLVEPILMLGTLATIISLVVEALR